MHRFVERHRRGKATFEVYMVPLAIAPMIDRSKHRNIPWGRKEVVPGRGLVDMEDAEK